MFCNKKSFGLIEVVVVLGIFLLVIGAVLSISALSYKNLILNENRWKASLIAQNWIDYYRNRRDSNVLIIKKYLELYGSTTAKWDDGFPSQQYTTRCYNYEMVKKDEKSSNSPNAFPNLCNNYFFTALLDQQLYPGLTSHIFKVTVTWQENTMTKSVYYSSFLKDLAIVAPTPTPTPTPNREE